MKLCRIRFQVIRSVIVLITIIVFCGCEHRQNKYAEPEKMAGQINWIIREAATGKVLDNGTMAVRVRDIKIKKRDSQTDRLSFLKKIELNRDFYFEMAEFPEADHTDMKGFGLVAGHRTLGTSCWEWFTVDREKRATKLQETGELGFDADNTGNQWEVTRTEFLTDVTFRVTLSESHQPEDNPKWRITILKGSYVNWPSLVGDTVILKAGF